MHLQTCIYLLRQVETVCHPLLHYFSLCFGIQFSVYFPVSVCMNRSLYLSLSFNLSLFEFDSEPVSVFEPEPDTIKACQGKPRLISSS